MFRCKMKASKQAINALIVDLRKILYSKIYYSSSLINTIPQKGRPGPSFLIFTFTLIFFPSLVQSSIWVTLRMFSFVLQKISEKRKYFSCLQPKFGWQPVFLCDQLAGNPVFLCHDSNSSRLLIHMLKYFCALF